VYAGVADVLSGQRGVFRERHADQPPDLVARVREGRDVDVVADPVAFEKGDGLAGGQVFEGDRRADVGGDSAGIGEVRHLDLHGVPASGRVDLELAKLGVHVGPFGVGGPLDPVSLAFEGVGDGGRGAHDVSRLADEEVDVLGPPGADVMKLERPASGERDPVLAARGLEGDARDVPLSAVDNQALCRRREALAAQDRETVLPRGSLSPAQAQKRPDADQQPGVQVANKVGPRGRGVQDRLAQVGGVIRAGQVEAT